MPKTDNFSRCSNGHIIPYGADFCPWCGEAASNNPKPSSAGMIDDSVKTINMEPSGNTQDSEHRTVMLTGNPAAPERTVVMRPESSQNVTGRIVGFLMTYSSNPLGAYYPLHEGRETIGRGKEASIRIDDTQLSKEHAVILYRNKKFIFEDRLSTNGSILNGSDAIGQFELHHGDVLEMGKAKYVFVEIPQNA